MKETYEPNYIFWYEREFSNDIQVSRGMNWLQRHFYRALCIAAMYCSTRPYLPDDDDQLWLLADAESKDMWTANKGAVLVKFQRMTRNKVALLSHKRLLRDWERMLEANRLRSDAGKASAESKRNKKLRANGGLTDVQQALNTRSTDANYLTVLDSTEPDATELNPNLTQQNTDATLPDLTRPDTDAAATQPTSGSGDSGRVMPSSKSLSDRDSGSESGSASVQVGGFEVENLDSLTPASTSDSDPDVTIRDLTLADNLDKAPVKKAALTLANLLTEALGQPCQAGPFENAIEDADFPSKPSDFLKAIRFVSKSDYWGKPGKGELDGSEGFLKAFSAILGARARYYEAKTRNKDSRRRRRA
jgi:uncharacterized protein YdaU (DUF1376 family)